ncbi:hemerythrin superfamily protein [Crossiella equi]|uniref:Hemerythrin superfamily protein n=1 Tax=Crossiella equi TaxID=130796 RepID=A0ABS5ALF4_9PSEU|nr:hemerythrin domain-containing protein [Crossiella equi]MBP2477391.1 hemerythrin superfamily protein [Crossiella equi]
MDRDAVSLIKADHRVLEGLFDQVKKADGEQRKALLAEVKARLDAHSRAEEEYVYPALIKADPGERGEVHHGAEEHLEADELLGKAIKATGDFDARFQEFVDAVSHHVEEEEQDLLPALREAVPAAELRRLGDQFDRARREHLAEHGIGAEVPTQATREQLYERAKAAGIPGRSTMTKEELAEALRQS